ncbi:MAG TPA: peptidoglycan DD-metalloendopeptidase family protein [Stellaceae bacterium]|nr:peptidoglycan DD-metalloendopeptidase family protein [Stellaceae bacterium]
MRPDPSRALVTLLPAVLILAAATGLAARAETSPQTRLKAVEKLIDANRARQDEAAKAAEALAAEIAGLQSQSVAAASAEQAREVALTAAEAQLAALAADGRAKTETLERDGKREATLLMALTRVAAAPREALVLAPRPPVEALRGALVMARAVPALEAGSATLKRDIDALDTTKRDLEAAEATAASERQGLADEQTRLAALIARKAALQQTAQDAAEASRKRLVVLAAQAGSLRDLIEKIEADRRRQEAERAIPQPGPPDAVAVAAPAPLRLDPAAPRQARPFSAARGAMVYPVSGTLVARFGAPDEFGGTSRGLTFETRPGAEVVAPFDGQVAFAGPFRSYGQILIIAHGDGYHSLVAGLDRVDSSVGQWLLAGEPIGKMSDGVDRPRLYFELRHNNQPTNPAPWLTSRVEKVNE